MGHVLYIVRHAKSSWDHPDLDDFHRPLNKRGLRDAPRMARLFAESFGVVDQWLTSPAIRALSTAVFHASATGRGYDRIRIDPRIYAAEYPTLVEVIQDLEEGLDSVALFGHNPGVSDLLRVLTGVHHEDLPTLGTVRLEIPSAWSGLHPGSAHLTHRFEPRETLGLSSSDRETFAKL